MSRTVTCTSQPAKPDCYVLRECGLIVNGRESFIPAAAYAAGAQGAFFQTDVEINNTGTEEAEVHFQWLPRGEDNSEPIESEPIALAAGQSLRYENVLTEVFGLEPDSLGALKMVASTESVIGMSRTYNIPAGKTAGTFGQGLPAIRATEMIMGIRAAAHHLPERGPRLPRQRGLRQRSSIEWVTINIELFNAEGESLETKTMELGPYSNSQINHIFQDYLPINGYVDVWADSVDALYYCYGSMLDNLHLGPDHDPAPGAVGRHRASSRPRRWPPGSRARSSRPTSTSTTSARPTSPTGWRGCRGEKTTARRSTAICSRSPQEREFATPTCSTRSSASSPTRSVRWRSRRADRSSWR